LQIRRVVIVVRVTAMGVGAVRAPSLRWRDMRVIGVLT